MINGTACVITNEDTDEAIFNKFLAYRYLVDMRSPPIIKTLDDIIENQKRQKEANKKKTNEKHRIEI